MKKHFSKRILLFWIVLFIGGISSGIAQVSNSEILQDLKQLSPLSAKLFDQMDILDRQKATSKEAADLRRDLGVFSVDLLNVYELGNLALTVQSRFDRQQSKAAYLRGMSYFSGACVHLKSELNKSKNDANKQVIRNSTLILIDIADEIRKIFEPSLNFYNSNISDPKYNFVVDGEEANTLNTMTTNLFIETNSLKKEALNDNVALLINQQLGEYVLQMDQINILFALWINATSEKDKEIFLVALGNEIQDIRSAYQTVIYNMAILFFEIQNNPALKEITRNIDKLLTETDNWLDKYENIYAQSNKVATRRKEDRERKIIIKGLEAEGVYDYARNQSKSAIAKLSKAIELDPLYPKIQYYLALSFVKIGDETQAIKNLSRFKKQWKKAGLSVGINEQEMASRCELLLNQLKENKKKKK